MQKLDFETQKLDLPAFQGSEGDQNYVEKESLLSKQLPIILVHFLLWKVVLPVNVDDAVEEHPTNNDRVDDRTKQS